MVRSPRVVSITTDILKTAFFARNFGKIILVFTVPTQKLKYVYSNDIALLSLTFHVCMFRSHARLVFFLGGIGSTCDSHYRIPSTKPNRAKSAIPSLFHSQSRHSVQSVIGSIVDNIIILETPAKRALQRQFQSNIGCEREQIRLNLFSQAG